MSVLLKCTFLSCEKLQKQVNQYYLLETREDNVAFNADLSQVKALRASLCFILTEDARNSVRIP